MDNNVIPFPENYKFDISLYFRRGWALFKLGSGSFVGFTILFIIIMIMVALSPFINVIGGLFQYCLIGGIYIFCRNLMNNKDEFAQFFQGFNHFIPILIFFLIISIFLMPLSYVFTNQVIPPGMLEQYLAGEIRPNDFINAISQTVEANYNYVMTLLVLITIVALYLHVSYSFTLPLIVDSKLQFWNAMESSRKIIAQKFFHFLGMYLLLGLILLASMILTCGIGIIVSLPFSLCVVFSAYDEIVYPAKEEKTPIDFA